MNWIKTDMAILPTLAPKMVTTPPEKFDHRLVEKCGVQIGHGIRVGKARHTHTMKAYQPVEGCEYGDDTVIVDIMPSDTTLRANGERYVFTLADWEAVRDVALKFEPRDNADIRYML